MICYPYEDNYALGEGEARTHGLDVIRDGFDLLLRRVESDA